MMAATTADIDPLATCGLEPGSALQLRGGSMYVALLFGAHRSPEADIM
jgi:hypothetical protein